MQTQKLKSYLLLSASVLSLAMPTVTTFANETSEVSTHQTTSTEAFDIESVMIFYVNKEGETATLTEGDVQTTIRTFDAKNQPITLETLNKVVGSVRFDASLSQIGDLDYRVITENNNGQKMAYTFKYIVIDKDGESLSTEDTENLMSQLKDKGRQITEGKKSLSTHEKVYELSKDANRLTDDITKPELKVKVDDTKPELPKLDEKLDVYRNRIVVVDLDGNVVKKDDGSVLEVYTDKATNKDEAFDEFVKNQAIKDHVKDGFEVSRLVGSKHYEYKLDKEKDPNQVATVHSQTFVSVVLSKGQQLNEDQLNVLKAKAQELEDAEKERTQKNIPLMIFGAALNKVMNGDQTSQKVEANKDATAKSAVPNNTPVVKDEIATPEMVKNYVSESDKAENKQTQPAQQQTQSEQDKKLIEDKKVLAQKQETPKTQFAKTNVSNITGALTAIMSALGLTGFVGYNMKKSKKDK